MILCPLCENLFTRFEYALDGQWDTLATLLSRALAEHGQQSHDTLTLLDISMFFSVPMDVYRAWIALRLAPAPGVADGEAG